MKKIIFATLALCVVCLAFADDHIIRFRTSSRTISLKTSAIRSISYDYHDQDSIDKAIADSVRAEFVKDSLLRDSLAKEAFRIDSIGRTHTLGHMIDSTAAYSIFAQALHLTGLYDTLTTVTTRAFERPVNTSDINNGRELYCPLTSRNGFTVFVESDLVLKANGINNVEELIDYARRVYGNASDWYDYLTETGHIVSTGTDYTDEWNALHMFMAYHIMKSAVPYQQLTYSWSSGSDYWNYCNGTQPYDYYETALPKTLVKVWNTTTARTPKTKLYLNRYVANNTLTDEVGTPGSEGIHTGIYAGVRIFTDGQQHYNGYLHPIDGLLVYDQTVPRGVLHERMRFDFASMQPEMNNNSLRFLTLSEAAALNNGGNGNRLAFANDYFENIRVFNRNTCLRYNVRAAYNSYMSDAIMGWGSFDLALRLPSLPTGRYEVRIAHYTSSSGSKIRYSFLPDPNDIESTDEQIGTIKFKNEQLIDTIDQSIPFTDPSIGWTPYIEEEDLGIASDKALRERGYMRGPFSYADHAERGDIGYNVVADSPERNMRYTTTGNNSMRKILGTFDFKQGQNVWLRAKNVGGGSFTDMKFFFDYIEFVPVDVVNNQQYMEDWY